MNKRRAKAQEAADDKSSSFLQSGRKHDQDSKGETKKQRSAKSTAAINAPFGLKNPSQSTPTEVATAIELQAAESEQTALHLALHRLHSPLEWLKCYQETKKSSLRKSLRAFVQMQTINAVLRGKYFLENGNGVNLDKKRLLQSAQRTIRYENDHHFSMKSTHFDSPAHIVVIDGDCLDAAIWLQHEFRLNPVILNMASASIPGGGYRRGSAAQEENLHRRTNLFQCLEDPYLQVSSEREWTYPLPEFGGLYTPGAFILRGGEAEGYPFLARPYRTSFISAASYREPPLETANDEIVINSAKLVRGFKRKMEVLFDIALENGHDAIVLSAWGCGAYGCPPGHVARLFKDVIASKYQHSFKTIAFAIMDDQNAYRAHNPEGNLKPFARVFGLEATKLVDTLTRHRSENETPLTSDAAAPEPSSSAVESPKAHQ